MDGVRDHCVPLFEHGLRVRCVSSGLIDVTSCVVEPKKEIAPDKLEAFRPDCSSGPAYFRDALAFALEFYPEQLEAFSKVKFEEVTPRHFFVEYAWVVHATGFSAKQVGKMMDRLIPLYEDFVAFSKLEDTELSEVLAVCNNPQKVKAVRNAAKLVRGGIDAFGWVKYRADHLSTPELLQKLPYVGPVTCFHLARNIGLLECVKPDLHLVRMAEHWGYEDPMEMCRAVRPSGMPLGIVDLILWYSASTFGTLDLRKDGTR